MQLKQTNTLRSVFEQGYAETRHFGAQGLTLDYLFLAILKQEGGHASYLLRKLLKEWEIYHEDPRRDERRPGGRALFHTI